MSEAREPVQKKWSADKQAVVYTIAAFFTASLVPALIAALLTPSGRGFDPRWTLVWMLIAFPFSAAATLMLGLPAYLLLYSYRLVRWWSALGSGLVVGVLVITAIRYPSGADLENLAYGAALGGAAALAFWLVWRLGHKATP